MTFGRYDRLLETPFSDRENKFRIRQIWPSSFNLSYKNNKTIQKQLWQLLKANILTKYLRAFRLESKLFLFFIFDDFLKCFRREEN